MGSMLMLIARSRVRNIYIYNATHILPQLRSGTIVLQSLSDHLIDERNLYQCFGVDSYNAVRRISFIVIFVHPAFLVVVIYFWWW